MKFVFLNLLYNLDDEGIKNMKGMDNNVFKGSNGQIPHNQLTFHQFRRQSSP